MLLILIDRGDIALRAGVILEIGQRHIGVSRAEAVREQRIDQMLTDGLAEEVSRLLKSGVPRDAKAMKAIGYKEMIPYALGETTLDEAVYALKLNTRHYAKRQLTWMRREEDVLWVDALEPDAYDKLEAYYTQGEAK